MVAGLGAPFDKLDDLTPQFLALFALGVLAVKLGSAGGNAKLSRWLGGARARRVPRRRRRRDSSTAPNGWSPTSSTSTSSSASSSPARSFLLFTDGAGSARRVLTSHTSLRLGLFSYSIYLLHGPILGVVDKYVVGPIDIPALAKFGLLLLIGVPLVLVLCYGFHLVFERPSSGTAACALSEKSQACR